MTTNKYDFESIIAQLSVLPLSHLVSKK